MDIVRYKASTVVNYLHQLWRRMSKALNHCRNCSAALIAATLARYVNERRVSNLWSCDACGHEHETSAIFSHGGNHCGAENHIDFS
jgi:RNase P subunit RPR2